MRLLLEERVGFVIDLGLCGKRLFEGKIDRIARRREGTYEIHDYKTTQQAHGLPKPEDIFQLSLYQLGLQFEHPWERPVELVLHYLSAGRTFPWRQTQREVETLYNDLILSVRSIERETTFPAHKKTPWPCDWCEFRDCCPAWAEP